MMINTQGKKEEELVALPQDGFLLLIKIITEGALLVSSFVFPPFKAGVTIVFSVGNSIRVDVQKRLLSISCPSSSGNNMTLRYIKIKVSFQNPIRTCRISVNIVGMNCKLKGFQVIIV